jgi:outer membrane protein
MRCFAIIAGCLVASTLLAASPWTLTAAIAEARAHSPEAAIAAARLERSHAMVDQAGAANLPQLSLQAGYNQTTNPMMAFGSILNQGAFTPTIDFNAPGQVDNLNLTGIIGYNVYSGGRATAGLAAARSGVAASEQDRATTFARLDAAVSRAYFGIRQAREGLIALDAAVATYEESLRVARLRYDAGQMLKSELLNLEVQLAQTREQHLLVRHQATLVARQFLYLLGHRPIGEVALAASDDAIAAILVPRAPSIDQRPELLAMEARVEAAAKMADVARGARRPTVNAFASYQLDHGWRLNGNGDSWMAGLQAEWAVFDGKATSGKIRAARAQYAEAEAGLEQLGLALSLELEQARLAHEFAVEQLAVTATLVEQADESARISRARFEAGSLLSAELIGVETRLTEARMRRAVATASERVAVVELRRAAGLPILP